MEAAVTCKMYDEIQTASGMICKGALPAEPAEYGEVAKTINGIIKTSDNTKNISSGIDRLIKQAGADTMLQNAIRDGAEWAWIPQGLTCAFCITLALKGWQPASKKILNGGHAEHIHANCNCEFAIRFDKKSSVEGYDPEALKEKYDAAEGDTPQEKINFMRREIEKAKQAGRTGYGKLVHESRVVEVMRKEYERWIDSLSKAELHAIRKYTKNSLEEPDGKFYRRLNAMLRGDIPEDKHLREYADTISGALKRQPLENSILCYRNQSVNPFGSGKVGSTITVDQFYSTSVIQSKAMKGKYHLTIIAPKGTPGAYVENISRVKSQREFLIDKGCNYRLISIQGNEIVMEVII